MGRNHVLAAISAGALLFSSSLLATEKLNYSKMNQSIADVIANSLSQQSNITNLKLSIDGRGTDIDSNKFRANFSATANSTGWSKEPVTAKGFLKVEVEQATKDQEGQIELQRSITFKTDVLAMLKHVSQNQSKFCQQEITGIYGVLLKNECESVSQLQQAASVGDVFEVIKDVHAKHIASLEAIVADGKQNIVSYNNLALQQEAEKTLLQASKLLGIMKKAKMEQTKEAFTFSLKDMDFTILSFLNGVKDLVELDDSTVVMSDSEITFTGEMDVMAGSKLYMIAKPEIVNFLKGLEEGAEGAKQMMAMKVNVMLALMNEKLK